MGERWWRSRHEVFSGRSTRFGRLKRTRAAKRRANEQACGEQEGGRDDREGALQSREPQAERCGDHQWANDHCHRRRRNERHLGSDGAGRGAFLLSVHAPVHVRPRSEARDEVRALLCFLVRGTKSASTASSRAPPRTSSSGLWPTTPSMYSKSFPVCDSCACERERVRNPARGNRDLLCT